MQDILDMTVPIVVETSGRTERAYDIFSRLLKDRIVLLGSEVNDAVASLICAQLLFLESQDPFWGACRIPIQWQAVGKGHGALRQIQPPLEKGDAAPTGRLGEGEFP